MAFKRGKGHVNSIFSTSAELSSIFGPWLEKKSKWTSLKPGGKVYILLRGRRICGSKIFHFGMQIIWSRRQ